MEGAKKKKKRPSHPPSLRQSDRGSEPSSSLALPLARSSPPSPTQSSDCSSLLGGWIGVWTFRPAPSSRPSWIINRLEPPRAEIISSFHTVWGFLWFLRASRRVFQPSLNTFLQSMHPWGRSHSHTHLLQIQEELQNLWVTIYFESSLQCFLQSYTSSSIVNWFLVVFFGGGGVAALSSKSWIVVDESCSTAWSQPSTCTFPPSLWSLEFNSQTSEAAAVHYNCES